MKKQPQRIPLTDDEFDALFEGYRDAQEDAWSQGAYHRLAPTDASRPAEGDLGAEDA